MMSKLLRLNKVLAFALALLCVSASLRFNINAQVRPVNDHGALGISRLLLQMSTTASVMMIGAHPDDEDSALLAYLARGENARTAYLSLTRGDGGQNIIGPELFESLGVIRTEELLQARRLDGAEQYFTRAFDYGFSKTLAEAQQKWPEDVIKCDAVRAIRTFRPLVVISRFSGTPNDGHGQHQYAGYITPLAVEAAVDPEQCKGAGEPWQVLKVYVEQGFSGNDPASLKLNTGDYDQVLGRSYFEIAMEGRSQHRSQGEGRLEFRGEVFSGLNIKKSETAKKEPEASPFDDIDISINGIASLTQNYDPVLKAKLADLQSKVESAKSKYRLLFSAGIVTDLAAAAKAADEAIASTTNDQTNRLLAEIRREINSTIGMILGVQIDALADRETVAPGGEYSAMVNVFISSLSDVTVTNIALNAPKGWQTAKAEPAKPAGQGVGRREVAKTTETFAVRVPAGARPTQPYWLESGREKDLFDWPATGDQTLPFSPQDVTATVTAKVNGIEISLTRPVQFRYADPSRGEIRREVNVVPVLSLGVDQKLLIVPQSSKPQTRTLTVSITNNSAKPVSGVDALNIPVSPEWNYTKRAAAFNLTNKGEKTSVAFDVTIPAETKPGTYHIYPNATFGEGLSTQTMNTIAYPHIQTHRYYTRAETVVNVLDLKTAAVNVAYIMGSGDEVPEAIRQMGLNVTMLEEKDLASGDLAKFDTIVVGIRAFETRPDLTSNNQRLLDYVKNGGNVIVQYQRGKWTALAPLAANTQDKQGTTAGSIARVVDENAKVTILQPNHPVFNFPNKITDADFAGWVQERNAYNLVTFDEKYVPLLESHDAGELENRGGLVTAQIGKGTWTYCSYSMFRQLPAGVPGAYRLFANLLSLPKAGK